MVCFALCNVRKKRRAGWSVLCSAVMQQANTYEGKRKKKGKNIFVFMNRITDNFQETRLRLGVPCFQESKGRC